MKDLFFDLDHTLWDFEKNSMEALREGYEEMSLSAFGIESVDEYISKYKKANVWCWGEYQAGRMNKAELRWRRFSMTLENWGLENNSVLGGRLGSHYVETSPYKTYLVKDALKVVTDLYERGHRLIMLTNGFEEVQHIKVKQCGLEPFFETVLTSDALGVKKPHIEIFNLALKKTDSKREDAIMLGDSLESDIVGAREAGWGQVYYNPFCVSHDEVVLHEVRDLISILDLPLRK